jgi:virginiamycin B lyase
MTAKESAMPMLDRRRSLWALGAGVWTLASWSRAVQAQPARRQSWPLATAARAGIHDLAPAPDGGVWFTAQASGHLGWFDPRSGRAELIALGRGSAPHGVIAGPDKAAWITDGGLNAIVRVGWPERALRSFALPQGSAWANLNTATFDVEGDLWFTGQSGVVGKLAVKTGTVTVKDAPHGRGPYGICTTPAGDVWWCSLAGSFIARIDRRTGESTVVAPPTRDQGARRVWSDSHGRIWVSEWTSGNLSVHDPAAKTAAQAWRTWKLPAGPSGEAPHCYAVYVDDRDIVWASDWGDNAVWRFDPAAEQFERFGFARQGVGIRQINGRHGEVWLPESGTDHVSVIRSA